MELVREKSQTPAKGARPLPRQEAEKLAREVPTWTLTDGRLEEEFHFSDFDEAMRFVSRVARIAKEEDHHPDIAVSYNKVHLTLSTHSIGGLSRNDFIVAAKIERLL